ncbi:MAG: terpene cyclase/mutase family protein [Thermoplasmata archaeon]|nr:terpene cyclase/mutase family protein [Thermoplasmata archaeon]
MPPRKVTPPPGRPVGAPRAGHRASSGHARALTWLLEPEQPSMRYLALTQLLGRPPTDPDVRAARDRIPRVGWAAELLSRQLPDGAWVSSTRLYHPKYLSTNWMLLILADLGMTRDDPRIATACELWIERFAKPDGGFGMDSGRTSHLCLVGNTARALLRFGYDDHPAVRSSFDWLVQHQAKLGGWSCFGSGRNLDSWEGLSAFAAYPRARWTSEMTRAVERGAEFFLERELFRQGDAYPPWSRFHYPVHYYYDLLVGLDLLTELGYGRDPRLRHALRLLDRKRRPDGRWNLDAVHPDAGGAVGEWIRQHPNELTPFALEAPGAPSKMITLQALRVLARRDAAEALAREPT